MVEMLAYLHNPRTCPLVPQKINNYQCRQKKPPEQPTYINKELPRQLVHPSVNMKHFRQPSDIKMGIMQIWDEPWIRYMGHPKPTIPCMETSHSSTHMDLPKHFCPATISTS